MGKITQDNKKEVFIDLLENFTTKYIVNAKGLSKNTIESYSTTFALFINFMKTQKGVCSNEITFSMLDNKCMCEFLDYLETDRGNSVKTRNQRLAAFKSFAKYAENYNFEASSKFSLIIRKIPYKRGKGKKRAYFNLAELKILFSLPNLNTISGRRDAVLLPFMFATGARAQEICDLRVRDVMLLSEGKAKITLHGKGMETRRVIVSQQITHILMKYIKSRHISDRIDEYVFCTQNNPYMSVSAIEEIFKKYVDIAKSENKSLFNEESYPPHSMRHSTAVSMLAAGVPLSVIQVFLGHKDISTTQIYAEITQPDLDKEVLKWNESYWSHVKEQDYINGDNESVNEDIDKNMPEFLRRKGKH